MIPIVLHHGIFGFDQLSLGPLSLCYFNGIDRALAKRGHAVKCAAVHPTAPVSKRAHELKATVQGFLAELGRPKDKVLLIAHSMGGLDARYMVSQLGMARHVAALVTIASPHRGSPSADVWMHDMGMRAVGVPLLGMLGLDMRGAVDLTTGSCRRFNQRIIDRPTVRYYSVTAACPASQIPPPLLPGYFAIYAREGDNDGMVSVQSAIWGKHLGTWPVHHLHAINHRFPTDCLSPVGDIVPFYLELMEQLEADGL